MSRASVLLQTVALLAATSAGVAQSIPLTRLDTWRLEGLDEGTAVVRDSAAWQTLWWYFGREYRSTWDAPLPDSVATPPAVDFSRNIIIVVSSRFAGCDDDAVAHIDSVGEQLRVVLGVAERPDIGRICLPIPEVGNRVQAAVVPGRWRQVTFVGARPDYQVPPPATWWAKPSVAAALDTGQSMLKAVSWRVLPQDSTLPLKDLRRLAHGAAEGVGPGLGLLGNPRVRASTELLVVLETGPHALPLARRLLFDLHGDALARDRHADTAALRIVIAQMGGGDHPDIAQPLISNHVVRDKEPLLRALSRTVWADSVSCYAAVAVYASRWPAASELRSYCPGPPDLTRHMLPTVRVTHLCATTFRIRNELMTAADIAWDVPEAGEGGRLVVPPRGHRPHSDAVLTTAHRGTLRLSRDGRLFVIIGNSGGRPCAESDTVPVIAPPPRFFFPDDIGRTVSPPSDTALRYYRRLLRVAFFDTTGGEQVRAAIQRWRATIVAGGPYPNPYLLRVRDPGPTWEAWDSARAGMAEEPGVEDVVPIVVRRSAARQ